MYKFYFILVGFLLAANCNAQDLEQPSTPLQKAADAMRNHRYTEAEDHYRNLVKQNPDDITLQQLLAHALMNQKRFRESDSILYKLVEKDSNNIGNYWYLGLSAERQLLDSAAAANFKYYIFKSQTANSRNLKAWLHVGSAYRRMMHTKGINAIQFADMVKHYQLYLAKNPADPYADEIKLFLDLVAERKPKDQEILIWSESD